MRVKNVIFDLDGLLFDSEKTVYEIYSHIAKEEGKILTFEVFVRDLAGRSSAHNCNYMAELCNGKLDASGIEKRFRELETEAVDKGIALKCGARELLSCLSKMGVSMMIASSGERARAEKMLSKAGIEKYFTGSVYGEELRSSKPSPDIFLHALEVSGYPAEDSLILEDSEAGIEAAVRAGIRVICVPDMKLPSNADRAFRVMKDLLEVMELLREN